MSRHQWVCWQCATVTPGDADQRPEWTCLCGAYHWIPWDRELERVQGEVDEAVRMSGADMLPTSDAHPYVIPEEQP
jgi:hypothetical protein